MASVLAIPGWTLFLLLLFTYERAHLLEAITQSAYIEAQTNIQKDLSFRRWATMHGGVYVPPTDTTPPNPYLAHIPNRDIVDTAGRQLTLMNPAYMMRQVMTEYGRTYGVLGKLTSERLINPVNAPDRWEAAALQRFTAGDSEVVATMAGADGREYLRVMRAVYTESGCLKCHGYQGYAPGDVRGGLSVQVPLAPHAAPQVHTINLLATGYGALWAVGCLLLWYGIRRARRDLAAILEARTGQARLEAQMTQAYKLASVGELSAEVAHEFNNLLSIISTYSQLGGTTANPQKLEECFTTIRGQVKRGAELVASITSIVRQREQVLEPLDLAALVDEVLRLETRPLQRAGIAVVRRYAAGTPPVPGLHGELQQVVINLLHNARDAMLPRGGGSLTVSLAPVAAGVELRIADTGQGIPADTLPRIFEPFFSTKTKDGKGTGLGLSLSRKIIERHGGSIRAANLPGGGAEFVITLPASVAPSPPA